MSNENWNYYDVLEVPQGSSQDSIYQAYKVAKETYSLANPNIFNTFTETEAIAWVNVIEEAYSVIGHPNTRRVYDLERMSFESQNSTTQNFAPQPTAQQQEPLCNVPEGFSETKISRYEVQPNMEKLIESQELFDGLFLKKIREYKKIDLPDFSKHTCIAIRHLYAIENNNFSVLPAPVFVRGYITQYCRVLELDQKKVVTSFMSLLADG